MIAAWLKNHFTQVWWFLFFSAALPGLQLIFRYFTDMLGSNPLETLTLTTGRAALVLLTVTLAVTPMRKLLMNISRTVAAKDGKRLSDWNWLVRTRRLFGLWSFTYAVVHTWIFLEFDIDYDWLLGWEEINEKPYIAVGTLALLLLVPIAATSTNRMMQLLGKYWRPLHMLSYPIAVLALLHFWWLTKAGLWKPLPETIVLGIFLGYRLLLHTKYIQRWEGSDGREVPERTGRQHLTR